MEGHKLANEGEVMALVDALHKRGIEDTEEANDIAWAAADIPLGGSKLFSGDGYEVNIIRNGDGSLHIESAQVTNPE